MASTIMVPEETMGFYFSDYPSIARGLTKLAISKPTDLQQQLLQVTNQIDNLLLIAPESSGKTTALLLQALRRFVNEEQGIMVVLTHSKQLCQQVHHFLQACSGCTIVNLYQQQLGAVDPKTIIIGSPLQVNNLWKKEKDNILIAIVPEADLLFSFGYGEALHLLAGSLNQNKVVYKLGCTQCGEDVQKFKTSWMKKTVKINYQPPAVEEKIQTEKDEQITHFYGVGDSLSIPISLYITLKFGLVSPKVLVLVDNLREVYRYSLFLERCRVPGVGVYNHENPLNLRFYVLSVWMTGATNILIATPQIISDLTDGSFKKMAKKAYKRDQLELVHLTAIVSVGLDPLPEDLSQLFSLFHLKPFLMTFLENNETDISRLQAILKYQKDSFEHVVAKQIPITSKEIDGFRYRINDVWSMITNNRADLFQQLDFKKKILKTPQLQQELQKNDTQRSSLVKSINDLRKKIDHNKVVISQFVPEYLVPQCLKATYSEKMKIQQSKQEQETPMSHQKVKRVLRHVNLQDQNPDTTDVSRLKLVSSRKRWKLLHGFKLKKRNKRLEQKGIFQS